MATVLADIADAQTLPSGWVMKSLGRILPLEYGKALPAKARANGGGTKVYGSSGAVGEHSERLLDGPAIIVGRKGSAGAVHYCDGPCWPIDTAYYVRLNSEVDPRFAFHLLTALRLDKLDQSTAIPSLSRDSYNALMASFPDAETQRQIAVRIDELFAEIDDGEEELRRARQELTAYRKSLLKAAVTGELTADWREANPPSEIGEELLNRILVARQAMASAIGRTKRSAMPVEPSGSRPSRLPETWGWAAIGQLAIIDSGATPKGIEQLASANGEVPWFKVSSMTEPGNEAYLSNSKWWVSRAQAAKANLPIFPAGSIVFPKLGGALLTNKRRRLAQDSAIDLNNMAVVPVAGVETYLWHLIEGLDLAALSDGSIVPQLKSGTVATIGVGLPPADEMAEVVGRLQALDEEAKAALKLLDAIAGNAGDLRQSILAAAFRGELVQ